MIEEQTCAACAHDHCAGQNVTGRGQHGMLDNGMLGYLSNMPDIFMALSQLRHLFVTGL